MNVTLNYNMLNYLTTLFEQVYLTAMVAAASELLAYIFSGLVFERLGVVRTYVFSCLISALGGFAIIFYGLDNQDSALFPLFFLLCKFGTAGAYNGICLSNSRLFEVQRASFAFGSGNILARLAQGSSPILSTMSQPIPMYIFTLVALQTAAITLFLKVAPVTVPSS